MVFVKIIAIIVIIITDIVEGISPGLTALERQTRHLGRF